MRGFRYGDYADLRPLVHKTLKRTDRILVVGCGNSNFSAELYDDGFEEVSICRVVRNGANHVQTMVTFRIKVLKEMWQRFPPAMRFCC